MENGLLTLVKNCVFGIRNAVFERLITHIDGVATTFGKRRLIDRVTGVRCLSCRLDHSRRACLKGIFSIVVSTQMIGEARQIRRRPRVAAYLLHIIIRCRVVVVDDDFALLPIALTRRKNNSPGVFEHRNEVGHDDGLREKVFGGAEKEGSLPFPEAFRLVVVVAVACPERQMAVLQSLGNLVRARNVLHPRLALVIDVAPSDFFLCQCRCRHKHQAENNVSLNLLQCFLR